MAEPHISLDPNHLSPVEEKLRGPLEEQLTSALKVAKDKIEHDYHGESVDQVTGLLLQRTKDGLHPDIAEGFQPDPSQLRQVAEAIVERQ